MYAAPRRPTGRRPHRRSRPGAPSAARSRGRPAGAARRAGRRRCTPGARCRRSARRARRRRSPRDPCVSGHCENGPAMIAAPGLSLNECRGSVDSVTGMPRRVDAASRCSALCHAAISRPVGRRPSRLKCVICLPSTNSRAEGEPKIGFASSRSPIAIIVWKNRPAFSSMRHRVEQERHALVDRRGSRRARGGRSARWWCRRSRGRSSSLLRGSCIHHKPNIARFSIGRSSRGGQKSPTIRPFVVDVDGLPQPAPRAARASSSHRRTPSRRSPRRRRAAPRGCRRRAGSAHRAASGPSRTSTGSSRRTPDSAPKPSSCSRWIWRRTAVLAVMSDAP